MEERSNSDDSNEISLYYDKAQDSTNNLPKPKSPEPRSNAPPPPEVLDYSMTTRVTEAIEIPVRTQAIETPVGNFRPLTPEIRNTATPSTSKSSPPSPIVRPKPIKPYIQENINIDALRPTFNPLPSPSSLTSCFSPVHQPISSNLTSNQYQNQDNPSPSKCKKSIASPRAKKSLRPLPEVTCTSNRQSDPIYHPSLRTTIAPSAVLNEQVDRLNVSLLNISDINTSSSSVVYVHASSSEEISSTSEEDRSTLSLSVNAAFSNLSTSESKIEGSLEEATLKRKLSNNNYLPVSQPIPPNPPQVTHGSNLHSDQVNSPSLFNINIMPPTSLAESHPILLRKLAQAPNAPEVRHESNQHSGQVNPSSLPNRNAIPSTPLVESHPILSKKLHVTNNLPVHQPVRPNVPEVTRESNPQPDQVNLFPLININETPSASLVQSHPILSRKLNFNNSLQVHQPNAPQVRCESIPYFNILNPSALPNRNNMPSASFNVNTSLPIRQIIRSNILEVSREPNRHSDQANSSGFLNRHISASKSFNFNTSLPIRRTIRTNVAEVSRESNRNSHQVHPSCLPIRNNLPTTLYNVNSPLPIRQIRGPNIAEANRHSVAVNSSSILNRNIVPSTSSLPIHQTIRPNVVKVSRESNRHSDQVNSLSLPNRNVPPTSLVESHPILIRKLNCNNDLPARQPNVPEVTHESNRRPDSVNASPLLKRNAMPLSSYNLNTPMQVRQSKSPKKSPNVTRASDTSSTTYRYSLPSTSFNVNTSIPVRTKVIPNSSQAQRASNQPILLNVPIVARTTNPSSSLYTYPIPSTSFNVQISSPEVTCASNQQYNQFTTSSEIVSDSTSIKVTTSFSNLKDLDSTATECSENLQELYQLIDHLCPMSDASLNLEEDTTIIPSSSIEISNNVTTLASELIPSTVDGYFSIFRRRSTQSNAPSTSNDGRSSLPAYLRESSNSPHITNKSIGHFDIFCSPITTSSNSAAPSTPIVTISLPSSVPKISNLSEAANASFPHLQDTRPYVPSKDSVTRSSPRYITSYTPVRHAEPVTSHLPEDANTSCPHFQYFRPLSKSASDSNIPSLSRNVSTYHQRVEPVSSNITTVTSTSILHFSVFSSYLSSEYSIAAISSQVTTSASSCATTSKSNLEQVTSSVRNVTPIVNFDQLPHSSQVDRNSVKSASVILNTSRTSTQALEPAITLNIPETTTASNSNFCVINTSLLHSTKSIQSTSLNINKSGSSSPVSQEITPKDSEDASESSPNKLSATSLIHKNSVPSASLNVNTSLLSSQFPEPITSNVPQIRCRNISSLVQGVSAPSTSNWTIAFNPHPSTLVPRDSIPSTSFHVNTSASYLQAINTSSPVQLNPSSDQIDPTPSSPENSHLPTSSNDSNASNTPAVTNATCLFFTVSYSSSSRDTISSVSSKDNTSSPSSRWDLSKPSSSKMYTNLEDSSFRYPETPPFSIKRQSSSNLLNTTPPNIDRTTCRQNIETCFPNASTPKREKKVTPRRTFEYHVQTLNLETPPLSSSEISYGDQTWARQNSFTFLNPAVRLKRKKYPNSESSDCESPNKEFKERSELSESYSSSEKDESNNENSNSEM